MSYPNARTGGGPVAKALAALFLAGAVAPAPAQVFSDSGFTTEVVATFPAYEPVGLTWTPDGRMLVWQENGIVRVVEGGQVRPDTLIDIRDHVNTVNDRGFLGLAVDPDFAHNGHLFLLYSYEEGGHPTATGPKTARLTRVTIDPANPNRMLPGSEVTILGTQDTVPCSDRVAMDCIGSDGDSHSIGTVRFAPDGKLFVGAGDGASYSFADTLALRAQDLNSLNGKILRINPDGSAPADNPFYDGANSNRSKVFDYGLRNPYRFALQPGTGLPYIGDVGWNTYEEVDRGRGANFGWPCYEGNFAQPQ